jgi:hypothetical protein
VSRKIDKAKRMAAGHACFTLFTVCNGLSHGLRQIASISPPSGIGLGHGLTEKEREFVLKQATDFNEKAEVLRKLGWRFKGVKST